MNALASAPDADTSDPLLLRLLQYGPFTGEELGVLARLSSDRLRLEAGAQLVREGGDSTDVFILQSGAMHASAVLPGGARQILRIHHPGDLMNTACVGWSRVTATLTAGTAAEVSRFPRSELAALFGRHPRVAAMLYGVVVVDSISLNDRLKSLGRTDGRARIATLLLELNSRQKLNDGDEPDVVQLFLTQNDIADAVGMTKVHVNRLLRELTDEGLIAREGRRVRLADKSALVAACDFVDRYAEMATDWLPAPRQG